MGDSWRDLLALQGTKPLIRAGLLNAMGFGLGQTRCLGASPGGRVYTSTADTDIKTLELRVGQLRSAHVALVLEADVNGNGDVGYKLEWIRDSDDTVLDSFGYQTPAGGSGFVRRTQHLAIANPDEDGYFKVSMRNEETVGPVGSVDYRNVAIYEIPGTPTGVGEEDPLAGITEANYDDQDPQVKFVHGDEAKTTGSPDWQNRQNAYPKCGLLAAQAPVIVHTTTSTSYVTVLRVHVDKFLGDHCSMSGGLRVQSTPATASAKLVIKNEGETLSDDLGSPFTDADTGVSYYDLGGVAITALTNNGDMVGKSGWLEIQLKTSDGAHTAELTGARIMQGIETAAARFMGGAG